MHRISPCRGLPNAQRKADKEKRSKKEINKRKLPVLLLPCSGLQRVREGKGTLSTHDSQLPKTPVGHGQGRQGRQIFKNYFYLMDINNREQIVAYFAEHDIVAEQADKFIRFWQGKSPRSLQEQADKWIERTDMCFHISTRQPPCTPPPAAATGLSPAIPPTGLIPASVWYKQHQEEEARLEAERIRREGPPVPMPESLARKFYLKP